MYKDVSLFNNTYKNIAQQKKNIFFEEPCSIGRINKEIVYSEILKKIIIDDSFCDKEQLHNQRFQEIPCGINLKIQKIGGIYPCVKIAKEILERQMMIGCNLETSLGISAGIHLGEILKRISSNTIFTDLDSDILLGLEKNSPKISPHGRIPQNAVGLGYTPKINDYELIKVFHSNDQLSSIPVNISYQNKDDYIYDRVTDQYCSLIQSSSCHGNIIPNSLRIFYEYAIFNQLIPRQLAAGYPYRKV